MQFTLRRHQFQFLLASATFAWNFSSVAIARPVSFLDGTAMMNENRPNQNEAMVAYTFQRNVAAGLHGSTFRDDDGAAVAFAGPILNYLVKRWNEEGRQSNVYLGACSGAMARSLEPRRFARGYAAMLDADTETRSYYFSLHHEVTASQFGRYAYSRVQGGFSPYLAAFGGLHSWVVVRTDYDGWRRRGDVTPLLRFFFQNVLWEFGESFNGRLQFAWAVEM